MGADSVLFRLRHRNIKCGCAFARIGASGTSGDETGTRIVDGIFSNGRAASGFSLQEFSLLNEYIEDQDAVWYQQPATITMSEAGIDR
jgi:hypothetical protein